MDMKEFILAKCLKISLTLKLSQRKIIFHTRNQMAIAVCT